MPTFGAIPTLYALPIIAILATGCPDPESEDEAGVCLDGGDEVSEEDCEQSTEDGPLDPNECLYEEDPNRTGYRVQCEGEFHSKIDFKLAIVGMNCEETINEEFCSQVHPFGPLFDTYKAPDVMACCGEAWDPVEHLDVYQDSCMSDLSDQACASIAIRLEKAIEAGDFKTEYGDFTKKAKHLHAYVESHLYDCAKALYSGDSDPDPGELVSKWEIPNNATVKGWWPAKEIVVYVEAGTSVVDVHRPESEADWLECHGPDGNNDEIFENQTTPSGNIVVGVDLEASVDASLVGSVIAGSGISGSMNFAPNCVDQGCPSASWSYRGGTDSSFTMEDLNLYTANFEVASNTAALTIERARVELWTQAQGKKVVAPGGGAPRYVVPAGQAWFYVAGMANGVFGRYMTVNSTDIEITVDHGTWTIGSFDIVNLDGEGRTWTLTLDDSRWRE